MDVAHTPEQVFPLYNGGIKHDVTNNRIQEFDSINYSINIGPIKKKVNKLGI